MKKYICWISLALALTLFTGPGFSQPSEGFKQPPSKKQIEKIRKRIETLKMWRLTKSLDLDEETASKLFPLINQYDKEKLAVQQAMRRDMKELRSAADTAGEEKLRGILKRLRESRKRLQEINDEEIEKLREVLSVRELAKFIIFRQDFDREMKKIIARVREKNARGLKKRGYDLPQ